jgi:hypothetical protein
VTIPIVAREPGTSSRPWPPSPPHAASRTTATATTAARTPPSLRELALEAAPLALDRRGEDASLPDAVVVRPDRVALRALGAGRRGCAELRDGGVDGRLVAGTYGSLERRRRAAVLAELLDVRRVRGREERGRVDRLESARSAVERRRVRGERRGLRLRRGRSPELAAEPGAGTADRPLGLAELREVPRDDDELERVLVDNPARLYGF